MRFVGWAKTLFDTDVKLPGTDPEPAASARAQRLGLLDFLESKQEAEEITRSLLATLWSRYLDVIDFGD